MVFFLESGDIEAKSISYIEINTNQKLYLCGSIRLKDNSKLKMNVYGNINDSYTMELLNTDISVMNNSKIEITSPNMSFSTVVINEKPPIFKFYIGQSLDDKEEIYDSNVYDASLKISAYDNRFPIDFTSGPPVNVKFIFRVTDNQRNPIENKGKLIMVGLAGFGAAFFSRRWLPVY
ncbi:hypothetical protein HED55_06555 [Ochrobactrum haematophilum]|uniref:Uncharacterized protein n=1 Tax=Brucella haematophila TaxID=419474 RepID=A0ABX1DLD3_9HYPH|nr:hypothetical protein [Brucella haematophila]